MTFEDARAAFAGRLDTAWTASHAGMLVQYENRQAVDLSRQMDPFVSCEILFNDGEQKSLEETPIHRYYGAAYLSVWVKEGEGTKTSFTLLAELSDLFKTTTFGGVQTQTPRPLPGRSQQGWYIETVRIPFYFDDRS